MSIMWGNALFNTVNNFRIRSCVCREKVKTIIHFLLVKKNEIVLENIWKYMITLNKVPVSCFTVDLQSSYSMKLYNTIFPWFIES